MSRPRVNINDFRLLCDKYNPIVVAYQKIYCLKMILLFEVLIVFILLVVIFVKSIWWGVSYSQGYHPLFTVSVHSTQLYRHHITRLKLLLFLRCICLPVRI